MYIYLVTSDAFRAMSLGKIGSTHDPYTRLSTFNVIIPPGLTPSHDIIYDGLWKTSAETRNDLYCYEMEVHTHFKEYRMKRSVKSDTEWFDFKGKNPYDVVKKFIETQPWVSQEVKYSSIKNAKDVKKVKPSSKSQLLFPISKKNNLSYDFVPYKWDDIENINYDKENDMDEIKSKGDTANNVIWAYKKWCFQNALLYDITMPGREIKHDSLEVQAMNKTTVNLWNIFYENNYESKFWNIYFENRLSIEEIEQYTCGNMKTFIPLTQLRTMLIRQKGIRLFLDIVGMTHSHERRTFTHKQMEEIGPKLEKEEEKLRNYIGLRGDRKKNRKWNVSHTIDLVKMIMAKWTTSMIKINMIVKKINRKTTRFFDIELNTDNQYIWDLFSSYRRAIQPIQPIR